MTNELSTEKRSTKRVPNPSFVKLAMKNMVRKGNQSIIHFLMTASGLLAFILFFAWLFRPTLPN